MFDYLRFDYVVGFYLELFLSIYIFFEIPLLCTISFHNLCMQIDIRIKTMLLQTIKDVKHVQCTFKNFKSSL